MTDKEFHAAVYMERRRQIAKGYDATHDDQHGVDHLLIWAQEYAYRNEPVKCAAVLQAARECLYRNGMRSEL